MKRLLAGLIWKADGLQHNLPLRGRWLCDLLDISCGLGPSDWHRNHVSDTRLNRWAWRVFG